MQRGSTSSAELSTISSLLDRGEVEGALDDYLVTFVAGIFRSIRFGAASAHGRANLVRFNFFAEHGAFARAAASGRYRVDPAKMRGAITALSKAILELQGNGDYAAAQAFMKRFGEISPTLTADLERLQAANIPVDVLFEQAAEVLGLRGALSQR